MTWSAPIDRAVSTFLVLHTAVTSAPNDLAIWTANVPTPPDAPSTRTLWPRWIRPLSRRPRRAVIAATGTAAASSNDRLVGFAANLSSITHAYSAKAPRHTPNTSSPGLNCVYTPAHGFNLAGHINAGSCELGFAQPPDHEAHKHRLSPHKPPVKWVDGSRANFYQNLAVPNGRLFNLFTFKNFGRTVVVINNGFHEFRPTRLTLVSNNLIRRLGRLMVEPSYP